jgi:hypothetical protein
VPRIAGLEKWHGRHGFFDDVAVDCVRAIDEKTQQLIFKQAMPNGA